MNTLFRKKKIVTFWEQKTTFSIKLKFILELVIIIAKVSAAEKSQKVVLLNNVKVFNYKNMKAKIIFCPNKIKDRDNTYFNYDYFPSKRVCML